MDRQKAFDGFDFYDKALLHDKIDPISAIKLGTFVDDRDMNLSLVCYVGLIKFKTKTFLIGGL